MTHTSFQELQLVTLHPILIPSLDPIVRLNRPSTQRLGVGYRVKGHIEYGRLMRVRLIGMLVRMVVVVGTLLYYKEEEKGSSEKVGGKRSVEVVRVEAHRHLAWGIRRVTGRLGARMSTVSDQVSYLLHHTLPHLYIHAHVASGNAHYSSHHVTISSNSGHLEV
jgi:hypothetical protein